MNLEVDSAVLKLLTGEVARSSNLSVVITCGSRTVKEVTSADFSMESLNDMLYIACKNVVDKPEFRVAIRHTSEELKGTEIVCKLSLNALKVMSEASNVRHSFSLKLFGPDMPRDGEILTFGDVSIYPLLLALADSPSYYKIQVYL
jgi:hypothetical protein